MTLALAGCGSGASQNDTASSTGAADPATTTAEAPTASTAPAATASDAAATSGGAEATAAQTDGALTEEEADQDAGAQHDAQDCTTASLSAEVTPAEGGGAAGSVYWSVILTNTGSAECSLLGYPGVSFADASGAQVGEPAEREVGDGPVVTLAPGASAVAALKVTNPGVIDGCTPTTASSVVIYPPDQTESLTATAEIEVCAEQSSTTVAMFGPVS